MRIVIKTILIIAILWIGLAIFTALRLTGFGMLPLAIVGIAMLAAVKGVWSYKPSSSKDIALDKES